MNIGIALLFTIPILAGCTTLITKGKIVDGEYVATEFIRIRGIGKGEFPDGTKGEGKPMVEMPQIRTR